MTIIDLEPLTDYTVYLSGGSVNPKHPDFMTYDKTVALNFRTDIPLPGIINFLKIKFLLFFNMKQTKIK